MRQPSAIDHVDSRCGDKFTLRATCHPCCAPHGNGACQMCVAPRRKNGERARDPEGAVLRQGATLSKSALIHLAHSWASAMKVKYAVEQRLSALPKASTRLISARVGLVYGGRADHQHRGCTATAQAAGQEAAVIDLNKMAPPPCTLPAGAGGASALEECADFFSIVFSRQ